MINCATIGISYADKNIKAIVEAGVEFRCYNNRVAGVYTTLARYEKMVQWILAMDKVTKTESYADFRVGSDWYRLHLVNVGGTRLHITQLTRVYGF